MNNSMNNQTGSQNGMQNGTQSCRDAKDSKTQNMR